MNRAPVTGRGQRRTGRTVWMLESEDVSRIVERLLARGFLAAGPGCGGMLNSPSRAALRWRRTDRPPFSLKFTT